MSVFQQKKIERNATRGQNTSNEKGVKRMKEMYVCIFQIPVAACSKMRMVSSSNLAGYMNVSDFLCRGLVSIHRLLLLTFQTI